MEMCAILIIAKITKDVDVVFHLAALIAIPYSYVAPDSYLETNVKGVINICQAALENGVQRVVHTSTSEVYGTAQYVPIDEKHPLQPQSPYSASKIAADAMAMSFLMPLIFQSLLLVHLILMDLGSQLELLFPL